MSRADRAARRRARAAEACILPEAGLGEGPELALAAEEAIVELGGSRQTLLLLRDDHFPGEEPNGRYELVHHYLHALQRAATLPQTILMLGHGVRLLACDCRVREELGELGRRGVALMACARSLREAGIGPEQWEPLPLESLNSIQVVEALLAADRVITLT